MAHVGNVGSYLYKAYDHTGANREDLADWIANISPYDTPLSNTLGRTVARSTYHEWLIDSLASVADRGIQEGKDWAAPTHTAPTRPVNWTEIFLKDIAVTETQREINAAGFSDAYAYQVEKATKEIMRERESALMNDGSTSTGGSGTATTTADVRVMKSLEEFITTTTQVSTDYVNSGTALGTTAMAGFIGEADVNDMLQDIWTQGGNTDLIVAGAPYKRQISNFTANSKNTRYISASEKELIVGIDVYDSDFGVLAVQLNRWSPVSTNTTYVTVTTTATTTDGNDLQGRIWYLERAKVRIAELRPLKHRLMGTRGDSTVGQVVTECTLEVGNEAALGVMKGVNNKSLVT
jgi:hypothetical protein